MCVCLLLEVTTLLLSHPTPLPNLLHNVILGNFVKGREGVTFYKIGSSDAISRGQTLHAMLIPETYKITRTVRAAKNPLLSFERC